MFSQIPEFYPDIVFISFSIFLSPPQTRESPDMDLVFNAEIRFRSAFNALQINSNQVFMTFVLFVKHNIRVFPGRKFHPRVWAIARRGFSFYEMRASFFKRDATLFNRVANL